MISVLLVDDHPVVIEGLRKVLATAGDLLVTGEAYERLLHEAMEGDHTLFIGGIRYMAAHGRPPLLVHHGRYAGVTHAAEPAPELLNL